MENGETTSRRSSIVSFNYFNCNSKRNQIIYLCAQSLLCWIYINYSLQEVYELGFLKYIFEYRYRIMKQCWATCPDHRPTFSALKRTFSKLCGGDSVCIHIFLLQLRKFMCPRRESNPPFSKLQCNVLTIAILQATHVYCYSNSASFNIF